MQIMWQQNQDFSSWSFFFFHTAELSDHKWLELVCTCTKVLVFKRHANIWLIFVQLPSKFCIRIFSLWSPIFSMFPAGHSERRTGTLASEMTSPVSAPGPRKQKLFFVCFVLPLAETKQKSFKGWRQIKISKKTPKNLKHELMKDRSV